MRPTSLTATALILGCLTLFSCSHEDSPVTPAASSPDAGTDADSDGGCAKHCSGVCVSGIDALTGCADTSCESCTSFPHRPAVCNRQQSCSVGSCDLGYLDCDDAPPGCETHGADDPKNCGSCGTFCGTKHASASTCVAGKCTFACAGTFAHCGDDPSTGCETDLSNDSLACGACGHSCLGGACVAGVCQPP
jgi:hypothetical protein